MWTQPPVIMLHARHALCLPTRPSFIRISCLTNLRLLQVFRLSSPRIRGQGPAFIFSSSFLLVHLLRPLAIIIANHVIHQTHRTRHKPDNGRPKLPIRILPALSKRFSCLALTLEHLRLLVQPSPGSHMSQLLDIMTSISSSQDAQTSKIVLPERQ